MAHVEDLSEKDRESVVDVLATAFHDYPVMGYMLGRECRADDEQLRSLMRFYADKRLVINSPVLGVRVHGEIAAVCLVSVPDSGETPETEILLSRLKGEIGDAAYYRMTRFENASDAMVPDEPYHFIGMLAVSPAHQKKGYGKLLIERVKEISRSAESAGICLTTETQQNLPFYERMGFFVTEDADIDDIHSWCLLWANRAHGDPQFESTSET
jgi:GNAT superfamily N-acetyltransferase